MVWLSRCVSCPALQKRSVRRRCALRSACGPVLTLSVCCRALSPVAAKGCPGGARRATEAAAASRRLPCGARVHGPAHNSLRSLRSLRSDRMRQKCPRGALRARAMNPALLGASHARRAPPGQPFAGTRAGTRRAPPPWLERQAVPGGVAVCGAEQRSLEGGARSALRELTCRILSERSERSERSELCGTPSRRAAQGSLSEAKAATVGDAAGHRLTRPALVAERGKRTATNVPKGPQAAAALTSPGSALMTRGRCCRPRG